MPGTNKIRVLVVDDHAIVRAGIAALLKSERDIVVVGEAETGEQALRKISSLAPDVVLMDLTLPGMDGIETTARIGRQFPAVRVLVLTQHDQEEYLRRVMESGARGYIVKNSLAEDLLRGIRSVHKGERFFDAATTLIADSLARREVQPHPSRDILTKREREILHYIAEGNTNMETAQILNISVRTVEFHRANLAEKLGLHDTASLVKYAIKHKIVTLDLKP